MNRHINVFRAYLESKNIECVYVWLAKEEETEEACSYYFEAEIYGPSEDSAKHLKPAHAKTGRFEVSKLDGKGKPGFDSEEKGVLSIASRILIELRDSWHKKEFPNSKFLTFCNVKY
jgi:hypothetical protein